MKRLWLPLMSGLLVVCIRADGFVVKNIRLEGLQRVSSGTVYNAFPVTPGDDVSEKQLADATRALFQTGYFEDIHIAREGSTLILELSERPTISELKISGNKAISTENLKKGLTQAGLSEGDIFRPATLEEMRRALEQQYVAQGRYSAYVEAKVTPKPRNRVSIDLKIHEGKTASIRSINIVGAHAFSQKALLDVMQLKVRHMTSWVRGDDKYSREKLAGDLERIRSYYMDRGYINFQIDSTQVAVTPDKRQVYITINVTEGGLYKTGQINLAGTLIYPEKEIRKLIKIHSGETFSRRKLTDTEGAISDKLGDKGYIFANVNPVPDINKKTHIVDVTFYVTPGKQIYVRHINFQGNTRTRDEVLRRESRQFEGALANHGAIKETTARLNRLGFFKDVDVKTVPVAGKDDQVDLDYSVQEQNSGSLVGSIGFSQVDGILLGGSINQSNFFGTGNAVNLNASTSKYTRSYSFSFNNPYYTVDGVSRGFNVYYNTTNYDKIDITNYNMDRFGGDMSFGYPVSDTSRLSMALGAENTRVKEGNTPAIYVRDYLKENGNRYNSWTTTFAWTQSTLNYGLLPTAGYSQSASIEFAMPGSSETYYKTRYAGQYLQPLTTNVSLKFRARLGYGNGFGSTSELPFYENYFGGGFGSVRGFEYGTLGPQALQTDGKTDPLGGNTSADGTVALLMPLPFIKDKRSVQTSLFVDTGNVWSTNCPNDTAVINGKRQSVIQNCGRPSLGSLRYSVGVGLSWITPIGPLTFSLAKPVKQGDTDDSQIFQFSLGTTF